MSRTCYFQGVVNVPMFLYPHGVGLAITSGGSSTQTPDGNLFNFGQPNLNSNSELNVGTLHGNPWKAYLVKPSGYNVITFDQFIQNTISGYGGLGAYFRGHIFQMSTLRGSSVIPYGAFGENQLYILHRIVQQGIDQTLSNLVPSRVTYAKVANCLDLSSPNTILLAAGGNGRWVFASYGNQASFNPNSGMFIFDPFTGESFPELLVYPYYHNQSLTMSCDLATGNNYGFDNTSKQLAEFYWDGKSTFIIPGRENTIVFDKTGNTGVTQPTKPALFGWITLATKNASFGPSGLYLTNFDCSMYWGVNYINESDNRNLNNGDNSTIDENGIYWVKAAGGPWYTSYNYTNSPSISVPYPLANQNVIVLPRNECCAENRINLPVLR